MENAILYITITIVIIITGMWVMDDYMADYKYKSYEEFCLNQGYDLFITVPYNNIITCGDILPNGEIQMINLYHKSSG